MGDPWKAGLVAELHDDAASRSAGPGLKEHAEKGAAGDRQPVLVGIWQAMVGLIALVQNDFYVATRDYPFKVRRYHLGLDPPAGRCPTGPDRVGPGVGADLGAGRPRPGARRSWMTVGIGRS
jgi:hypothetical protein